MEATTATAHHQTTPAMKNTNLTSDETAAIIHAVFIHGRRAAKTAIRDAWRNGDYRGQCLEAHDSTLQNMRNRDGGIEALMRVTLKNLSA